MIDEHKFVSAHLCRCGWEGDSAFTHARDVLLEQIAPWADALEEAHYAWTMYSTAKTLSEQASYFVRLSNAMGDLSSWHPGYDQNYQTLPWEREENV
jgi:hypothetical protein